MTSPYQSAVVGAIQTIPMLVGPGALLHIVEIPNWANYRYIIQVMTGPVEPGIKYIHESESAGAQDLSGDYDTGWWQSNAAGYVQGDSIPAINNNSAGWWTGRDLPVPATKCGPVVDVPESISLGYGCTGIRVISFVYFGAFDADTQNLTFKTSDVSGINPTVIPGGYYQDVDTGKVWRSSWQEPYSSNPNVPGAVDLSAIVRRVCKRGGLDAADYEADALLGTSVAGYPIARQANAADCMLPLLQAYFAFGSEYDSKLHFKFYGEDAAITVDRADLIEGNDANDGAITNDLRNQATEFPRRIVGSYMDPTQNYSTVNTFAERQALDVIAIGDQAFQIPVVMTPSDATKAVNKALKVAYATLEGTQEYSVPFASMDTYLKLAAGESLVFQGKRWVADEMILGNGSLKLTARYDRQSAYTSNVQPVPGNDPIPPSSPYSGPTTLIPMNLPAQRTQDSVGVYIVAASTDGRASWRGCNVQISYDGMETWQNALQINIEATIGWAALNEPSGGEPITVDVIKYDLESATTAQLSAQANAFAVIGSDDATQVGQFGTATETITDKRYELTNVSRTLGGVPSFPIQTGDRFTLMAAAYFLPIDPSFTGRTLYFRGVGFGEVAEDAQIFSLVYAALVPAETSQFITEDGAYNFVTEDGTQAFTTE